MRRWVIYANRAVALLAVGLTGFICWHSLTYDLHTQTPLFEELQSHTHAYQYHLLQALSALILEDWETALRAKKQADSHARQIESLFALLQKGGVFKTNHSEVAIPPLHAPQAREQLRRAGEAWQALQRFAMRSLRADVETLSANPFLSEMNQLGQNLNRLILEAAEAERAQHAQATKRFVWASWASLVLLALVLVLLWNTMRMHRQSEALRHAAEQLAQARSEFLAKMSHEIRTPLNGVIATADLLATTEMTAEQRDLLNTLTLSAKTLLELINDILDFSKIEAGKMVLETLPLTPAVLAEEVVSIMGPAARRKGLTLRTELKAELPVRVLGDPHRLRQILLNFVGNAIKFTEQGEIVVQVRRVESQTPAQNHVWLRFEVQDTGIGIPPDKQTSIFDSFTQADNSITRRYGGTGLGLTICKRLVELMGGRIGVVSQPGEGSCFWFEVSVPIVHGGEEIPQASASASEPTSLEGLRVLLVEDNSVNQKVAVRMLQKLGCEITVAENGQQALEILARDSFDVVLMDVQMPLMDGLTATRLLRAREQGTGKRQVVIALTANATQSDREQCFEAGMDDYLSKPLTLEALRAVLMRWAPSGADRAA